MALSEFELARVDQDAKRFIKANRPPAAIRDKLDLGYKVENQSITVFEIRPRWDKPAEKMQHPVAKATFVKKSCTWKVYWMRADLKWHRYDPEPSVDQLVDFLDVVEKDAYGCFWG